MEQGGHPHSTFAPAGQVETVEEVSTTPTLAIHQQGDVAAPPSQARDDQGEVQTSPLRVRDDQGVVPTTPSALSDAATRLLTARSPTLEPSTGATALAAELDNAIAHLAWVDRTCSAELWDNERFYAEVAVHDRAIERAIDEPSSTLEDTAAKARLALDDFDRFHLEGERDRGEQLVAVVLREAAALKPASAFPTPSLSFGDDAEIASLAAAFCDAFAAATRAERAYMADQIPEDEWQPHHDAAQALMDQLSLAEPKTIVGMGLKCLVIAGSDAWQIPRRDDPAKDGLTARIARQFETKILAGSLAPICSVPLPEQAVYEPIHAAIADSRKAEADLKAWSAARPVGGRRDDWLAQEDRLVAEQVRAREAAFATIPRTRPGQLDLVEFARWQIGLHGQSDDTEMDVEGLIWRDAFRSLETCIRAEVLPHRPPSRTTAPALSDLSTVALWHLAEAYHEAFMWWGRVAEMPWTQSDKQENGVLPGDVAEAEYERYLDKWSEVHAEAKRRQPANNDERNRLLGMRLAHEIECNGRVHDSALLADINAAWGA